MGVPVFSCYCPYRCGPHGQPAGLIRLRGHLLPLASYLGPWDSGGGPGTGGHAAWLDQRLLHGDGERQRGDSMGFSPSLSFFFFRAEGNSCQPICFYTLVILSCWEACLFLYRRSRAVFWLCHCWYPLQNKGNILHLHLELETKQGNWDATMEKL